MARDGCTFVDADHYTQLAVSNRALERADDQTADVRGLRDVNTGEVFYIEIERLYS